MNIKPIAKIYTDFPEKFGIPRQAGLVRDLPGRIVFEEEFRVKEAVRELDSFSHIWLIWQFSENLREDWSPTVRPPRLGGNVRVGVFATRSPFRPNNLGLSCVALEKVDLEDPEGPVLYVRGADLMSGTPIYDIKPYIPYADCRPEASEGFAPAPKVHLSVAFLNGTEALAPAGLAEVLALDPRPRYQKDDREYKMAFSRCEVSFRVEGDTLFVTGVST